MLIGIVATTLTNSWLSSRMTDRLIEQNLRFGNQFLNGKIRDESQKAQLLADALALNSDIQSAFAVTLPR